MGAFVFVYFISLARREFCGILRVFGNVGRILCLLRIVLVLYWVLVL